MRPLRVEGEDQRAEKGVERHRRALWQRPEAGSKQPRIRRGRRRRRRSEGGQAIRRTLVIVAAILALLGAGLWLRPLSALFLYRDLAMYGRGVRSANAAVGPYRIHYLSQGRGRPLLILPGLLASAADAAPLLADFADTRRAIAVDLLGQGRSSHPDIAYSIADQSRTMIGLIERSRWRKVDLLGVSMGGWVALDVAARRPDLVRTLIVADTGGLRFDTSLTPEDLVPRDPASLDALMRLQSPRAPPLPRFIARDALRRLGPDAWIALRAARSMASWRDALDGRLGAIRTATLVFWGRDDRLIPVTVGRRLAAGIPGARLVVAPGCGHLAVLDCRAAFVGAAESFLARQDGLQR